MFTRLVSLAFILTAGPALAAPETYTIDPGHTFPSFEVSHIGFSTTRGRFDKTAGRITLDREAKTAAADITIDATSIDTGVQKLDEHLRKPDFFDATNHPSITFKGDRARFNGDTLAAIEGNLTMRGQTKPVTLTVSKFICGNHPMSKKALCGADAATMIKRSEFGVNYGLPVIPDEVKLIIQVEAYKE